MITLTSLGPLGPAVGMPGGQGAVFKHPQDPRQLVKTYHPLVSVNPDGLEALVSWRNGLPPADRAIIDAHTSWPTEVIDGENGSYGVVIPHAPDMFFHTVSGDRSARVLSWAFDVDACRFAGLTPASPLTAVRLARGAAAVFDAFHRNGLAYRDVSGNNMFFSDGPRPQPYFIDCDGAHVLGGPEGLPGGSTPNWGCPWGESGISQDLYKLALLVLRVVFRYQGPITDTVQRIQVGAHPPQGAPLEVVDHLSSGLHRSGSRPTAAQWVSVLNDYEAGLVQRRAA